MIDYSFALSGYLAPHQVVVGAGVSAGVGGVLRSKGLSEGRVFVVADRAVAEAGLLLSMLTGLTDFGFGVEVFDDIEGEPNSSLVDRAAERANSGKGVVAIVGVGGGSALDVAKLVALLTSNPGSARDWLGVVEPVFTLTPLLLVPTTTGTGAEATRIAMISVDGAKRAVSCPQFVPSVAFLDQDLVANLPASVVAMTGMDAVSHAIESMLSTNRSAFTMALATEAVKILLAELETGVVREDPVARGKLLYAAHLSGLALNAGVVIGHSIAYIIARHASVSHGTSCALALPYCLAYNRDVEEQLSCHIARVLTGGTSDRLQVAAENIDSLINRIGLPRSLESVGISETELGLMADEIVKDYPRPNNPVPLDSAALLELLGCMHKGDLATPWISEPKGAQK